ncbi:MAG: dienelactone hydrolase family protein [Ilumatobacteraceae bacterium]
MRSRLLALSAAAALVLAACGGSDDAEPTDDTGTTDAPTDTTDAPVDTTADTADTVAPTTEAPAETAPPTTEAMLAEFETVDSGPYDIGVSTLTIGADTDRPLTVDVWFPIDDAGDAPLHQYTLIPGVYYESPAAVGADASQIATDGPFPLVVYSHGSGGLRYIASSYTEAIASHGYIVVAPDHTGNTAVDQLVGTQVDFAVNALNRPNDVEAVINAMLDPTNVETGAFVASVDPEEIAVTGHSFGGFTSLAMAGGYSNDLGTFAADPRVDAIIPLAPATGDDSGRLMSDADLEAISVPTLVMVGTADESTPIDPNVTRIWDHSSSEPLYVAELVDARHESFTDLCSYQEFLPTLDTEVPEAIADTINDRADVACSEDAMDIDRVDELTNTFAIAFLESVFRGGDMLTNETVVIPDDVGFMSR